MRTAMIVWAVVFSAAFLPQSLQAEEKEGLRDEKGYLVTQDNYLNIPSDLKVRKVANNVITPEPDTDYLARRLDDQDRRLSAMQARLEEMEKRMNKIESK